MEKRIDEHTIRMYLRHEFDIKDAWKLYEGGSDQGKFVMDYLIDLGGETDGED